MIAPFEREPGAHSEPDPSGEPAQGPDAPASPPPGADLVWRCTACGYQRLSDAPPERCPGCDADGALMVGRTAIEWRFLLRHTAG